jgi:hypothetical protein
VDLKFLDPGLRGSFVSIALGGIGSATGGEGGRGKSSGGGQQWPRTLAKEPHGDGAHRCHRRIRLTTKMIDTRAKICKAKGMNRYCKMRVYSGRDGK